VFVLPLVVPTTVLQHLATDNDSVVPHMLAAISGMPLYHEHNILHDLVRRAVALVIDRFLRTSADRYGTPQLGSHLERYLVDAMRRLVAAQSDWKPNGVKSRIWYGKDGLFAVWPNAALDMRKLFETDQLPGIPKAPETVLEILTAAGVFEPRSATETTWQIVPPESKTSLEAVKFTSPSILFAGVDSPPEPLTIALERTIAPSAPDSAAKAAAVRSSNPSISTGKSASGQIQQLSLPINEATEQGKMVEAVPDKASKHPAPPPAANGEAIPPQCQQLQLGPQFAFNGPMRLNATIRNALAQVIDTLNQTEKKPVAFTITSGLFIPLEELTSRQVDPSLAIRSLAELHMLIEAEKAGTFVQSRNLDGKQLAGMVLDPRFVTGLDPEHFTAPTRRKEKSC
jgi:conjugal transfer pilus assembly protein TraI